MLFWNRKEPARSCLCHLGWGASCARSGTIHLPNLCSPHSDRGQSGASGSEGGAGGHPARNRPAALGRLGDSVPKSVLL